MKYLLEVEDVAFCITYCDTTTTQMVLMFVETYIIFELEMWQFWLIWDFTDPEGLIDLSLFSGASAALWVVPVSSAVIKTCLDHTLVAGIHNRCFANFDRWG